MKLGNLLDPLVEGLDAVDERKEEFLGNVPDLSLTFKQLTKKLYDFLKLEEVSLIKNEIEASPALKKLVISNFDEEQIWQQLELQNKFSNEHGKDKMSQVLTEIEVNEIELLEKKKKSTLRICHYGENQSDQESLSVNSDVLPEGSLSDDLNDDAHKSYNKNYKVSVVDDQFFKLGEMEEFLLDEDDRYENPSDTGLDLFTEFDGNDQNMKYQDFFDPPLKSGSSMQVLDESMNEKYIDDQDEEAQSDVDMENDVDSNEDMPKPKEFYNSSGDESDESVKQGTGPISTFEKHQKHMNSLIADLEAESLNPKPWQLLGETNSQKRPENSLLAEDLEYDQALRPALIVTDDINERMENLIKQRTKDQAWDDVKRKVKPVENINEYKKRIVIDQEKSKLSLAEIYEKEYLEKQKGESKEEAEIQEHKEIKKKLNTLFMKLDALSNYHFVPRKPEPEIKIVSNLPAMMLEDVVPVNKSSASQLAPEEVLGKSRTELKGDGEIDSKDRKYSRRLKKRRQKNYYKKLRQKLADKPPSELTKVQAQKQAEIFAKKNRNVELLKNQPKTKSLKSSTFFSQLQDEVTSRISSKKSEMKKRKLKQKVSINSLKL